jgi:hypothetical protein
VEPHLGCVPRKGQDTEGSVDRRDIGELPGKPVEAVRGIDLQVERVESFGFLGPNLWHLRYFLVMAAIGIGRRPATGPAVLR